MREWLFSLFETKLSLKMKEWKSKGLQTHDVLGFANPENDNIVYTHNGIKVMMTQEELVQQEIDQWKMEDEIPE